MPDPETSYAFELVGGPFDGAVVSCKPGQYRAAVLILVDPRDEPHEPESGMGFPSTTDDHEAFIYLETDLEDEPAAYDGQNVYHRCADDLFRPAILKRALGF